MSDQEHSRACPSTEQDCDENQPTESRDLTNYDDIPVISYQESLWHQNASGFCLEEAHHYYDMLDDLSMFEVASPLLREAGTTEIPCLEDTILMENGQSSGAKKRHASDFLEMQTKGDLQEDGVKEDSDTSGQSKQQKRIRCPEVHNHNERIRRQKLKGKMKAIQDLIPNCNTRDELSTLDDAIKYIKTLQYQVQMMSIGTGYSTFHPTFMMMPQPIQQGMQIPYNTLPPFPQTGPPQGGMAMSSMFPSLNFPMNQGGIPNPYFSSSAASRLPAPAGIQPRNLLEQSNSTTSLMDQAPVLQQTTQGETNPSS